MSKFFNPSKVLEFSPKKKNKIKPSAFESSSSLYPSRDLKAFLGSYAPLFCCWRRLLRTLANVSWRPFFFFQQTRVEETKMEINLRYFCTFRSSQRPNGKWSSLFYYIIYLTNDSLIYTSTHGCFLLSKCCRSLWLKPLCMCQALILNNC